MGFFSEDMESMLEIFQMESMELIGEFDEILMQGEKENTFTNDAVNQLFRTVHTIKSSSAMMGLRGMSELTHQMEDLFHLFRTDIAFMRGQEGTVFDLMYRYSDYVKAEIERLQDPDFVPVGTELLTTNVGEVLQACSAQPEALPQEGCYPLRIVFQADCLMESVRAFMLIRDLSAKHAVTLLQPEDLDAEEASEQIRQQGLQLTVQTDNLEMALEKIQHNPYVKKVEVLELSDMESEPQPELQQEQAAEAVVSEVDGSEANASEAVVSVEVDASEADRSVEADSADGADDSVDSDHSSHASTERIQSTSDETKSVQSTSDVHASTQPRPVEASRRESKPVAEEASVAQSNKYANVKWERILELQNITGELLTSLSVLENEVEALHHPRGLEEFSNLYQRLLRSMNDIVMSISMTPISTIVPQLYRMVGDMSRKEEKLVDFVVTGETIEIDKMLLDALNKPLLHLLRNAIDHGIEKPEVRRQKGKREKGRVLLSMENLGDVMIIRVKDDGKGLNPEAILRKAREKGMLRKPENQYSKEEILEFIMAPGFSTNDTANQFSGRGVGMDVVQDTLDHIGGTLMVHSVVDEGSEFVLQFPVSITSVESLRFGVASSVYLLPVRNVAYVYDLEEIAGQIQQKEGHDCFLYENAVIPVLHLRELYGHPKGDTGHLLILKGMKRQIGLVIDEILGQQMAVEKPLPPLFGAEYKNATGITGCVILGDGTIGMVLSAECLLRFYEKGLENHE